MGKTKNRTDRIKREVEELNHLLVQLKGENEALKNENEALRRSLQQRGTAVIYGRPVPSLPLHSSSAISSGETSSFSADGNAGAPFGTGVTAPLSGFRYTNPSPFPGLDNPFSVGKAPDFGESTRVAREKSSFSDTPPIFGSSNPFSHTLPIFCSTSNPFADTRRLFGSSIPFSDTGESYSFGAVRPETHLGPQQTSKSETIASGSVRREPRRFRRMNRERGVGGETSTDQVPPSINDECLKDEPTLERMVPGEIVLVERVAVDGANNLTTDQELPLEQIIDTMSSPSCTNDKDHSKDDPVTDEEEVHCKGVGIEDDMVIVVPVPEVTAICDEKIVPSDVDGEVAKPKVVEEIGTYAKGCSCSGEVNEMMEEIRIRVNVVENVAIDDFEEVDKTEKLPNGGAYGLSLNAGIIAEGRNAEHESLSEKCGALDVELGRLAVSVEEEAVSNQQGLIGLNRIMALSEALNEKVEEELEMIKNSCNTKLVGKEEVEEVIKRLRENEEEVNAIMVDKEDIQRKLDELKRYVSELELDKVSHTNQIRQLRQEANDQLRMSDAMKEEVERKLDSTRNEYKAILREREEVELQLVEVHTAMIELQHENKSQRDIIQKLQKRKKTGRTRKFWPKVSSFFLFAATSVAFILYRL